MAIKPQKFVIDEAVLDLIGKEFKFDHAKGLAEWLKNSRDAYLRQSVPDDEQHIIIRLSENSRGQLIRIECIDFVGMDKRHIDEAFKRFFDPQAAKKGAKDDRVKTLGGHGNGGKFYMRQMFKTSEIITYRNGKMNIFGFNEQRQYGFEKDFEDIKMSLKDALLKANIEPSILPKEIKATLSSSRGGFTVVKGDAPQRIKGTANRDGLVDKLVLHPQARRFIERINVSLLLNGETNPQRLTPPKIESKEGFEQTIIASVPENLEWEGKEVSFQSDVYPSGFLRLKTSREPLRGNLSSLNTIDFIGEVGVIGTYRIHEVGATRFSGQTEFIYGECECPILEDPENDSVRNDRQKLVENERSLALLSWVRDRIEELAEKMEVKNAQEKKNQDLRNTSVFNELLNRWKNNFMKQIWAEMFMGKGPAGGDGDAPGAGTGGGGGDSSVGGDDKPGAGHEGGSDKQRRPRFPQVLVSGQDTDPLDSLATEPFQCDPRHPVIYQRKDDVTAGIYWINTSRSLAEKIINAYSSDSARWRDYLFQRYVDIIVKEHIYQFEKSKPSITADDVSAQVDDVTSKIHDQAAADLNAFLFDERFGAV